MEEPPAHPHLDVETPNGTTSSSCSTSCSGASARRMQSSAAILGGAGGDSSTARMGLYGALASSAAAVALQPLDVIKTRQQQQGTDGVRPSVRAAAALIKKEYGLPGFWRGSLATLLRVAPGTGIYFAALIPMTQTWSFVSPLLKSLPFGTLLDTSSDLPSSDVPAWYLGVFSGFARGAAVAAFNPISIVKTRMESSLVSGSTLQGFSRLLRSEPPLTWFRGAFATICRDMPFSSLFLVIFVYLKNHLGVNAESRDSVSFYALRNFACGAAAAAAASAITHPFDVLRTRLQLEGVAGTLGSPASGNSISSSRPRGLLGRAAQLARTEGFGVLGSGLGMRLLKRSLMAALTWTSFEELKTAVSTPLTRRSSETGSCAC